MSTEINRSVSDWLDEYSELFYSVSDSIWEFAETRYQEFRSSGLLCKTLEDFGFTAERKIAGMETAFCASWGSGKPVVAFLGEFDALFGISQAAGIAEKRPLIEGGNGHGCGHHALGTGAAAAACALKAYMEQNGINGTVRYYGCPAEEGGCGKVYLTRSGCFNDVDAVFTWHPFTSNSIMSFNVLATASAYFKFTGVSSHASGAPQLGRSALDAVTLMNIAVNYMREHVESDVRLHYAITDTGGSSASMVQSHAAVLQQIRAPRLPQVLDIYEREIEIAKGAALMTGTKLEIVFDKASSNMIYNSELGRLVHRKFTELGPVPIDEKDLEFARKIRATMSDAEKRLDEGYAVSMFGAECGKRAAEQMRGKEIIDTVQDLSTQEIVAMGSSDVGDVSWNVPLISMQTACFAKDTAPHSWQQVAQGKSALCHKGLLQAGKVLAASAAEFMQDEALRARVKEEFEKRLAGQVYKCPIPADVMPAASR